jgi:dihydrofolate reductase
MSKFRLGIAMSLDGFVAGPGQSEANPLGIGGGQLHEWALALRAWREPHGEPDGETNASNAIVEERFENVGANLMGRNMFGGGPGPWGDDPWMGWWGEEPPFHNPVFVVTHHAREPVVMEGGTTFHFVTDGIESALAQAREAVSGRDVLLGGGASVAQQYLAAGLLDEIEIDVVPVLLRSGERLFDNLGDAPIQFEQVRAVEAPGVTHIKYRVVAALPSGRG